MVGSPFLGMLIDSRLDIIDFIDLVLISRQCLHSLDPTSLPANMFLIKVYS
ncbi:hypothetical protein D3C86_1488600 [compost metagenome]